jgi:GntR family transcriptional regulator
MYDTGLARETVRRAIAELRKEGLVDHIRGNGYRVRVQPERQDLHLEPGEWVVARMPTPEERDELGIKEGVPVLNVVDAGGAGGLYPADQYRIVAG